MSCTRLALLLIVTSQTLLGCGGDPKSSKGFTLPDGDAEQGKLTFVELRCTDCHTVSGVDMGVSKDDMEMSIYLGGEVSHIKTYGELVTSIINPSHRLAKITGAVDVAIEGESKMRIYNDEMTVTQLVDLVAFLQSRYRLMEYEPTEYAPYPYVLVNGANSI